MDYTYLKNNAFHYAHLNQPGTFVNTGTTVQALAFDGPGTYYFYKENEDVNLLSLLNIHESITISNAGKIFTGERINAFYNIYLDVHNPDIVTNSTAQVILTVNNSSTSAIWNNTPDTPAHFSGKIPNKQQITMELDTLNCSVSGKLIITSDQFIPNT